MSEDLNALGTRHKYVSQVDMTHTQTKINYKNEEPASETWRGLDDRITRVELFYVVLNIQLQELNNVFTEVNTELLLCVAYLNPSDSFIAFDKQTLI